ncbi:putative glyoxylate/hydroxypyruvate reduct [Operophtera brumata]|uniref:Putative glyoxylate/hydroxypyruvate reduct n=1 Tax=Operophtera brumata TaxID=104452 RepID=A0A0L7LQP5_OPEBR|nr:putative glyoxylate/hydroxypyruvate reduct [Operophtera brumata]
MHLHASYCNCGAVQPRGKQNQIKLVEHLCQFVLTPKCVCKEAYNKNLNKNKTNDPQQAAHVGASKLTNLKKVSNEKDFQSHSDALRGLQPTVLPFMDHYPNAEAEIKKSLGGYDALIWNTKFRLTGELLDLAGNIAVTLLFMGFQVPTTLAKLHSHTKVYREKGSN